MASLSFLLKKKNERALRHGLILYFEALSLHLMTGFELSHAWGETIGSLKEELPIQLTEILHQSEGQGMQELLERLTQTYPTLEHRMWFSVLGEMYQSGAGMVEAVRGVSNSLRDEELRDLESHLRNLPTITNICLILFFFPPTALLLFAPLLYAMLNLF